ncbi:urease accessory protein [Arundinibacter roseus]|uniref:Urease accessory protein n=1 Tax=Arundinibacter roseus TaxID=2070510 RepID=A0A4R4JZK9_9BACT|nr:urease accessory protein [Arundinibacter roseus]TDB60390.1 urease accessory protein [Arundinibacter roseus]
MEATPLLFAALVGFGHAFEADHLVAVSTLVTRRNNARLAVKDGFFWGLGHTSTLLLIGSIFVLGRLVVQEELFRFLEAGVGLMLIGLGGFRLMQMGRKSHTHSHNHAHDSQHSLAYGVGLLHGLAGSGALMMSVLATLTDAASSMAYLLIFGIGSVAGMILAAGIFSVPFSEKVMQNPVVQKALTIFSSVLCIGLGGKVLLENLL